MSLKTKEIVLRFYISVRLYDKEGIGRKGGRKKERKVFSNKDRFRHVPSYYGVLFVLSGSMFSKMTSEPRRKLLFV